MKGGILQQTALYSIELRPSDTSDNIIFVINMLFYNRVPISRLIIHGLVFELKLLPVTARADNHGLFDPGATLR